MTYRIRLDDFVSDNHEARIKEIIENAVKERDRRLIKREIRIANNMKVEV